MSLSCIRFADNVGCNRHRDAPLSTGERSGDRCTCTHTCKESNTSQISQRIAEPQVVTAGKNSQI